MEPERSYYGDGGMERAVDDIDDAAVELAGEAERVRDEMSLVWCPSVGPVTGKRSVVECVAL